jgi:hypothetical protein
MLIPIGRAPTGNFDSITYNDDSSSAVCAAQYLGQAIVDPSWFGASSVHIRFVVLGQRTSGGFNQNVYFDLCEGSSVADGGGSDLWTSVVFNNPQETDSGWFALSGTAPIRLNLYGRKNTAAAGTIGNAYVLVEP